MGVPPEASRGRVAVQGEGAHAVITMTDDSTDSRRRRIAGRIDTLGGGRPAAQHGGGSADHDGATTDGGTRQGHRHRDADGEDDEADASDAVSTERNGHAAAEGAEDDESAADADDSDDAESEADADDAEDDEADADEGPTEPRTLDGEARDALEIELDPFVRALAARRADEEDETLDEYVVGSVKGYLAGMLGGKVSSPKTIGAERSMTVDADPVLDGLLSAVADDEEDSPGDLLIEAFAQVYDVPTDEESLTVAGLRDHEALLNGVVANGSNDLDDVSSVVQAAVEARLGIHD